MIFNGDFSTGDDSQWRATGPNGGTQDSGSNPDTGNCHFGPLKFLLDQSGRPGWWGQFNVPAAASVKQRCQVITHATPLRRDVDDYITLRVHTASGWSDGNPQWPVQLIEPNFQQLGNGVNQFTLVLKPTQLTAEFHSGVATTDGKPYWYEYTPSNMPPMEVIPAPTFQTGKAYELIIHIRWAFDSSGMIETWYRPLGAAVWAQTVSQSGFPTLQRYEDGSYPANNGGDVIQLYRGPSSSPCKVSMNGYQVCASFAEADGSL